MVCSNCGKELADGATYCDNCGADVESPVVLKATKVELPKEPRLKAEGPFINIKGFAVDVKNETSVMLGLIGAIVFYMAPFFSWLWQRAQEEKITASLFDLGSKSHEFGTSNMLLVICAVLSLLVGIYMLAMAASENIRPLRPYADNMLIRFIPVILAVIIFVLIMTCAPYKSLYSDLMVNVERAKTMGISDKFNGGRGIGPLVYIVGTVLYAISALFHQMKIKKN